MSRLVRTDGRGGVEDVLEDFRHRMGEARRAQLVNSIARCRRTLMRREVPVVRALLAHYERELALLTSQHKEH